MRHIETMALLVGALAACRSCDRHLVIAARMLAMGSPIARGEHGTDDAISP
jgi:hypothetical protein